MRSYMAEKSTFVHALLNGKNIFEKQPSNEYWYHGGESDVGLNNKGYIIKSGLPDNFLDVPSGSVVVLDDLMNEAKDHSGVTNLFTKLVHHNRLFVINITQNSFMNSKETRR